ncbi:MAG: DUF2207 domain-containing protein [Actinomycetota bacterium]|nr:DUF2207 domain-containing protein [Actinomycetota bacterium]
MSLEQVTAQLALVGVGGAAVLGSFLALLIGGFANRPRRGRERGATPDLRTEPPAVAAFVAEGYDVGDHAVPATLIDLAARRHVDIDDVGDGHVLVHLRAADDGAALAPFERRVLDHVRRLAVGGVVPAKAMTTGPADASRRWWKVFRREVVADAAARGLCRPRWETSTLVELGAGVVVGLACALGVNALDANETVDNAAELLAFMVAGAAIALGVVLERLHRDDPQRETPAGMEADAHWSGVRRWLAEVGDFRALPASAVRVRDRYLAYACAFELAPVAAGQLPLGAEDDRHAWSHEGGRWRSVRVRYPVQRPGWGAAPWRVLAIGAVAAVVLLLVGRALGPLVGAAGDAIGDSGIGSALALVVVVMFSVVLVVAGALGWAVVRAVGDLAGGTTTVEGVVVRRRRRSRGKDEHRYFVAVDDGSAERVDAWLVSSTLYGRVAQGDRVRATVHPRLGHVTELRVVASAPARVPGEHRSGAGAAAPVSGIGAALVERLERRLPPPPTSGPDPNQELRAMLTRLREPSTDR